jgi:hypothetical protein
MQKLDAWLAPLIVEPSAPVQRGRPKKAQAQTPTQRVQKHRAEKNEERKRCIAVLDMETDPFDNVARDDIHPFVACLYSDEFDPIIIWEEDHERLAKSLVERIRGLPGKFTIYAHNGGKFDYMFLVHLIRGTVSFKGRGIMSCKIGEHELRDSFHIIPERLAAFQKDIFDYNWMRRGSRDEHKNEIIRYLLNDCRYLLNIVQQFVDRFGFKLSIGQAAMFELKKFYTVKKFTKSWDAYIRNFFFGGRVECLQGRGHWKAQAGETYKLYDVNSMYPYVMANYEHPIGGFHEYTIRPGKPNKHTVFVHLTCRSRGALVKRGSGGDTTAAHERAEFRTSIWEYDVARKYNLIDDVAIKYCIDCTERSTFKDFVEPLYAERLKTKATLNELRAKGLEGTAAYIDVNKDDIFYKLLLNNAYGKFAQNPRNFKEHYLTDPDEMPPDEWWQSIVMDLDVELERDANGKILNKPASWHEFLHEHLRADPAMAQDHNACTLPHFEGGAYWIWQKPSPGMHFNNVGTAASITGAARAVLLEALQNATDPIYCDTDSIICRELANQPIHKTQLGAWDIEQEFSEVIINGKKLYACKLAGLPDGHPKQIKIRSKGANGLSWDMMVRMLAGGVEDIWNNAPTLTKFGDQFYINRKIKATAPLRRAG